MYGEGKLIISGKNAKDGVLRGASKIETAVCSTLGPEGHTVLIDKGHSHPVITKDGVSVAKAIRFSDPLENIGAILVQNTAKETNREAGDGTTTTTLLTVELMTEGAKLLNKGLDTNEIVSSYRAACSDISETIESYKRVISSEEDILHVATISANNDTAIGNTILSAFSGIGEDGIISIKDSYNGKDDVKFSSGLKYTPGMAAGYFVTDDDEHCIFENGTVVISASEIKDTKSVAKVLNWAHNAGTSLVIFAPKFGKDFITDTANSVDDGSISICPVKAPEITRKSQLEKFEDLAAYFGISMIGTEDLPFDKFDPSICVGKFGNCTISMGEAVFQDAEVNEKTLDARITKLKEALHVTDDDAEFALSEREKESLKERIATLTGGIATIFVGGDDAATIKERLDRYEDAVNAVRAAISDGIIPGGGTALLKAAADCDNYLSTKYADKSGDFKTGYESFMAVCKRPAKMIMANTMSAEKVADITAKIAISSNKAYGYDAKNKKLEDDMFKAGIIDPIKVTKAALKYSTSTATIFLTTDNIIYDEPVNNMGLEPTDPVADNWR